MKINGERNLKNHRKKSIFQSKQLHDFWVQRPAARPTTKAIGIARFDERRGTNVELRSWGRNLYMHVEKLYQLHVYIYIFRFSMYTYFDISIYTSCIYKLCMVTLFIHKIKNPDVSLRPQVCATIAGFMWRAPLKMVSLSTGFCLIFFSTRKRLRPKSYRRRKSFFDPFADF